MIEYQIENDLIAEEFTALLINSTLGERRPVNEPERIAKMLEHGNLIITARHNGKLGQKFRHNLRISYKDSSGATDQLTVSDFEVDGGVEQLRRFLAYLETARAAELLHSRRA